MKLHWRWMAAAVWMTVSLCAGAEELATLSNGFTMRCDHHALVDGQVRLYLSHGEENYIALEPKELAAFTPLPDAPPKAVAAAVAKPRTDGKLSRTDLHEMLAEAGEAHNLDVDLLASVVQAESGGRVRATSPAGAQGLMQLIPSTAHAMGVQNSLEPEQNVRGGTRYLDELLTRYHENLALALAAYNAGPAAVDKYHGVPPYHETRVYVARVIHAFNRRVLAHEMVKTPAKQQGAQIDVSQFSR